MKQFLIVGFALLISAFVATWPSTARAQITTNLSDGSYIGVIQNLNGGVGNGPCGIGGANGYAICTGGGIPIGYFATETSVNNRISAALSQIGDVQRSANLAQQMALQAQQSALQAQLMASQAQQAATQAQQTAFQAQRGISAVAAMANIWMPSAPGRTTWAVNGSTFQGEFGTGFSVAHRLPLSFPIAVTAAYGNGAGSAHVGRIGLMGEF